MDIRIWPRLQRILPIGTYYNTELKTGNGLDPFWGWSLLAYFMPIEQQFGYFPDEITEEQMDFCSYKQFLDKN